MGKIAEFKALSNLGPFLQNLNDPTIIRLKKFFQRQNGEELRLGESMRAFSAGISGKCVSP